MGRALIVVPPMVKYAAGPLLGPALLRGAAVAAGHRARVLDLNIRLIRRHARFSMTASDPAEQSASPLGDHSKPASLLSDAQDTFIDALTQALPRDLSGQWERRQPVLTLPWSHEQIAGVIRQLERSSLGKWIDEELARCEEPDLLGISLLYSGQVLAGLTVAVRARQVWPHVRVVLGGAHISALQGALAGDGEHGRGIVDRFVIGHAERTFVDLLDHHPSPGAHRAPSGSTRDGRVCLAEERPDVVPCFDDLHLYGLPRLVLPVQVTRGCAYGRCAFCTYGPVEGRYRQVGLRALDATLELAEEKGAALSFKDSFLRTRLLQEVADRIGGRVNWAACVKLHRSQTPELAHDLFVAGCRTVEIGLETLLPTAQHLIDKRQSPELFRKSLASFVDAGIYVVVNTMTGFPHQREEDERRWLDEVRSLIATCPDPRRVHLEHNRFELERLSRFSRDHRAFGIRITGSWPWASVLDWEAV